MTPGLPGDSRRKLWSYTTPARPRAYDPLQTPFRFVDLPIEIGRDGQHIPNPARQTAVFVVHGIGLQQYPETAVTLRSGFEDAIDEISREHPGVMVPPPFAYEGYWADYALFEKTFRREWEQCSERERRFFGQLWQRRSMNAFGTALWFVRENLRLFRWQTIKDAGRLRGTTLMAAAPLTILAAAAMLLRHPKLLADVLGDVRIYFDPRGDVEMAIVHRIDYRVGTEFLRLLGLDWDFRGLPENERVEISGTRHTFTYVTWVGHSLGTVISYNVIGDILQRAETFRRQLEEGGLTRGPGVPEPEEDRHLRANIERVERGLHRFVTLGSPLEQVNALFPGVLRDWPASAVRRFGLKTKRWGWWVNFYHVWDPVSSRLLAPRFAGFISNRHGKLLRVPGVAHTSYWGDTSILKYIVSRAYGPELCPWPDPRFLNERACGVLRHATAWITLMAVLGLMVLLGYWLYSGGLSSLWTLAKSWLAGLL